MSNFLQTMQNGTLLSLTESSLSPPEATPIPIFSPNISWYPLSTSRTHSPLTPRIAPPKTPRPSTPCYSSPSPDLFSIPSLINHKTQLLTKTDSLQVIHVVHYRCLPPTINFVLQPNHWSPYVNVQLHHPQNQEQAHPSIPACLHDHLCTQRHIMDSAHPHHVRQNQATGHMVLMGPYQYR